MKFLKQKKYADIFFRAAALFLMALFCLIIVAPKAQAQAIPATTPADSLTYSLYLSGQWNELIVAGKEAIAKGVDHYFMQMRVGIAFYNQPDYRKAIRYFETALRIVPGDAVASEYLYYSYLFSGRQSDAFLQLKHLTQEQKHSAGIKHNRIVEEIYMESGPGIFAGENIANRNRMMQGSDSIYSKNYTYQNLFYFHGGIRFRLSPAITLYQGYSGVGVTMNQEVEYLQQPWPTFTYRTSQNEYYGNLSLAPRKGWLFNTSWHLIRLKYNLREDAFVDSLNRVVADTTAIKENTTVFAFSLRRDFDLFALEATLSKGDFAGESYLQAGLFGYIYPLGNLNFYTQTGLIRITSPQNKNWIFHQMAGLKLMNNLWLEASGTFGSLQNYAENNAFVVYNTPEAIDFKLEGNLIFQVSNNVSFSLRTRYMQRVNSFVYYTSSDEFKIIEKPYGYYAIIGGIKWKL
jgi:tetratricopeptide (TPR) repeat protein